MKTRVFSVQTNWGYKMRFGFSYLCLVLVTIAFSGCSGDDSHGWVSGTILLDDSPLADAQVEFIPLAGGGTSFGRTDANGEFTMEYARDTEGASLGENEVRITTGDMYVDENEKSVRIKEKVPTQYNANTELKFDVKPGNNTADFALSSKGKIVETNGDPGEGE